MDDDGTSVLLRLSKLDVPLIYFVGYPMAIAVSAKYIGRETLTLPLPNKPTAKIFPRRWLGIQGKRIAEIWEAALRATVGLIHLKPGLSQARKMTQGFDQRAHIFFRRNYDGN